MTTHPSETADTPAAPAAAEAGAGTVWRAWHLHTASSDRTVHDRVATEVVHPVVAEFPGRPWFFLRYWHGGPHVRLRLGDLDAAEAARAERLLADRLADAGRLREGESPLDPEEYARSARRLAEGGDEPTHHEVTGLLEPGVHRFDYHPEYERYGGRELMPATEHLFQLSSRLVLAFLRREPSTGARAMLALSAGVAAGRALGDDGEAAAYYAHGLRAWREWATGFGYAEPQLDEIHRAARPTDRLRARLAAPESARPLAAWEEALTGLARRVRRETALHPAQVIVSHVHMLHNRLGLRVVEEYQTYARLTQLFPGPAAAPA